MNKIILIAGGAGYIGTSLSKKHMDDGDFVHVLDNLSNPLEFNTEDFLNKQTNPLSRFCFTKGDVEDICVIYNDIKFDVIYHLASESRPKEFSTKYKDIISSNVSGLLGVIDYIKINCLEYSCRLVYASTSEVYGFSKGQLKEDADLVINPKYTRSIYSLSKMLSENILQNESQINWNVVRFFNVYGGQFNKFDSKVVPRLKRCVDDGDVFEVYGDGNQTRSFTYISDIIDGLVAVSLSTKYREVFNLGENVETSINEFVELVKQYHPTLKVRHVDGVLGEPYRRLPDNSKSIDLLGWTPVIKLKTGISNIFG